MLIISPCFTDRIGGIEAHINALVEQGLCGRILVFTKGKFYDNADKSLIPLSKVKQIARDYDSVWSHDPRIRLRMRWFFRKQRLFNSSHGFVFHNRRGLLRKAYIAAKLTLSRALGIKVLCVSRSDFNFAEPFGAAYLPNFCRFESEPLDHAQFEKRDGILCVGRYSSHKRIDKVERFVKALEPHFPVTIACPGHDVKHYKEHLDATFLADLDDAALRAAYTRSRFFVSLSDFEGFGLAAIEAVALGCLPVLSNNDAYTAFRNDGLIAFGEGEAHAVRALAYDTEAALDIARHNLAVFEEYQLSRFKERLRQLHVY